MPLKVKEGDPAPDFEGAATSGRTIRYADLRGRKNVVLWFFPKADTPGCTKEGCDFRDDLGAYESRQTAVIGVSLDRIADQEAFAKKFMFNFPVLADAEGKVADAFGIERVVKDGVTYLKRTTVVIGKDGKVLKLFEGVKVDGHVKTVLESLRD